MYFERAAPFHPTIPQLLNPQQAAFSTLQGSNWILPVAPPSEAVFLLCSILLLPLFLRLSPDFNTTEGQCAAVLRTGCQWSHCLKARLYSKWACEL